MNLDNERTFHLRNRSNGAPVVVITGASAGIGRAVAQVFARQSWRVALLARDADRLAEAQRDIESAGGQALTVPVDVADAGAVFAAADHVAAKWGGIDVWVNNAMVTVYSPVHQMSPEEFRRVTEVTYLGQVNGTLAALRHMRPHDAGTIVQIGSALAYRSIPLQSAYCAAKSAVRGFTDSLRSELIHEGSAIRLTMVQLPAVNTPQFDWARSRLPRKLQPVPPIHQPEPVADAIYQAALEAPREFWVGTSSMEAILGQAVAPEWLDHMMAESAWKGQMTDDPATSDRPDNLFEPVAGSFDAHGRFDDRSRTQVVSASSGMVRLGILFTALGLGAGALLGAGMLGRYSARRQSRPAPGLGRGPSRIGAFDGRRRPEPRLG
ncbi:SDR family oxidoreductase [Microvirga roseola]|uniref:SDR family oxidoreductase n=1 Tax=Microvirga roseola TaxID=2883126 RepID=UPI001E5568F2|nr:SDR family oxidoreductase [Microvirga roseola]